MANLWESAPLASATPPPAPDSGAPAAPLWASAPLASAPAAAPAAASAQGAMVAPHPAPDGSGAQTNLSDADYYKLIGKPQPAAPTPATPPPAMQKAIATAQAREGGNGGSEVDNLAGAAANGLLFNTAPQVKGAVAAAQQYLTNLINPQPDAPTAGQVYDATRDVVRQNQAQFADQHPYQSFAAGIIGSLPIGEGIGGIVAKAPTTATKMARLVALQAAAGGGYGAGANPNDPASGAVPGAAVGAILAPAVAGGARLAQAGGNAVQSFLRPASAATRQASQTQALVAKYLTDQLAGRAPGDIQAAGASAPLTTAEALGRNAMGDVGSMARRPGAAPDLVNQTLAERQYGDGSALSGTSARLLDAFGDATGVHPTTAQSDAEALISKGRADVNPAYAAIRADKSPVSTPSLDSLAERDPQISKALGFVRANTRDAPDVPDAETWLKVHSVLAGSLKRDPVTGAVPSELVQKGIEAGQRDLDAELYKAIPGYREAQAKAAEYKAPEGAFNGAKGMLFGGSSKGKTVADVQKFMDTLKTPGETAAAQQAFSADMLAAVNRGRPVTSALLTPAARQKLAVVFGQDAADKISGAALVEHGMAKFAARASPDVNSTTSEAMMRAEAMDGSPVMDALGHGLTGAFHGGIHGAVKGAGTSLLRNGLEYVQRPAQNQAFRDEAIRYLMTPASEFSMPVAPVARRAVPGAHAVSNAATNLAATYLAGNK